jgi:hypothetical protein
LLAGPPGDATRTETLAKGGAMVPALAVLAIVFALSF